jgi:hypothetical protein
VVRAQALVVPGVGMNPVQCRKHDEANDYKTARRNYAISPGFIDGIPISSGPQMAARRI